LDNRYGEPDDNVYASTGKQVTASFEGLPFVLEAIEAIKQHPRNVVSIRLEVTMSDVKIFDGRGGNGTFSGTKLIG